MVARLYLIMHGHHVLHLSEVNERFSVSYRCSWFVTMESSIYTVSQQVSAVTDGPRDADLCTLKSYQLLYETQL